MGADDFATPGTGSDAGLRRTQGASRRLEGEGCESRGLTRREAASGNPLASRRLRPSPSGWSDHAATRSSTSLARPSRAEQHFGDLSIRGVGEMTIERTQHEYEAVAALPAECKRFSIVTRCAAPDPRPQAQRRLGAHGQIIVERHDDRQRLLRGPSRTQRRNSLHSFRTITYRPSGRLARQSCLRVVRGQTAEPQRSCLAPVGTTRSQAILRAARTRPPGPRPAVDRPGKLTPQRRAKASIIDAPGTGVGGVPSNIAS